MTQWIRRRASRSSRRSAPPLPPPPGGSGGSGFGGVGGVPPGPEAPATVRGRADAPTWRTGTATGDTQGGPVVSGPIVSGTAANRTGTGGADGTSDGARRGVSRTNGGTPEEQRFAQVYAEDRVGPMPYPHQASPDVAAARARVRALVDDLLPGGVDEGTGAALDPLIASWAAGWLARIDSEHADHHAVIDRLVGGARQQLAEAEAAHERDRRALEIARTDYADARERLMEPVGAEEDGDHRAGGDGDATGGQAGGTGGQGGGTGGRVGGWGRWGRPARGGGESRPSTRVGPSEPATSPMRVPPASYRPPLPNQPSANQPSASQPTANGPVNGPGAPPTVESP